MEYTYFFTTVLIILHCVECITFKTEHVKTTAPTATSSRTNGMSDINNDNTFPFTPPSFDSNNESSDWQITWEFIESRLNSSDTLTFLSTFNSGFERDLLYKQLSSCPVSYLCEFILIDDRLPAGDPCCMRCSCEFPECLISETCCLDVLFRNTSIDFETVTAAPESEDWFDVRKANCLPLHLTENEAVEESELMDGAFMYDSCPIGTNQQLRHNCTRKYTSELSHYEDIVPVMNIVNGDLYRNLYCAYCNNELKRGLIEADVYITCKEQLSLSSEKEIIEFVLEGNVCDLSFKPPAQLETCTVSISECNITGKWFQFDSDIAKACQIYRSPIEIKKQFYKNVFCAMCNGVEVEEFECQRSGPNSVYFGFSGLLKLETADGAMLEDDKDDACMDSQLYDYISETCRDIVCPPLTSLNHGQCLDMYTDVQSLLYTVYIKIVPLEVTTMLEAHTLSNGLLDYVYHKLPALRYNICGMQLMYHIHENAKTNHTYTIENIALEYYKMRVHVYIPYFHTPREIYKQLIVLHNTLHRITYFDHEIKQLNVFKVNFELVEFDFKQFDIIANLSVLFYDSVFSISNDQSPLPLQTLYENFHILTNESGQDIYHIRKNDNIGQCVHYRNGENNILHLNKCPKVLIEQDQTIWTPTDHGIMFINGHFNVNTSNFYYDINGNIMICSDIYVEYMSPFMPSNNEAISPDTIVSIASSSLSIIALLFTCVVFFILPKMRKKLPGKTNLSLILVLLCAQCLYLISSMSDVDAGSTECVTLGIMLHFFWLLSIMWMNVCTYHMFHVLCSTKVMSNKSGICRFILYHLYAITMAAIPVVINVSVSMITSDSYGYGVTACYISSQDMVLYTFCIPVFIIILSNMCLYFIVVYKIRRSPSVQKHVKSERNDLLIFVKLSTVTGATWIFGFVYTLTDNIVLSYLFILFNAGQGLFIMFALVLNRRVLNMIRSDVLGRSVTFTDNVRYTSKTSASINNK